MPNELPVEIHRLEDLNSSVKHYLEKKHEKNKLKKVLSDNKGFYFQWLCYLLGYPFKDYVSDDLSKQEIDESLALYFEQLRDVLVPDKKDIVFHRFGDLLIYCNRAELYITKSAEHLFSHLSFYYEAEELKR